jgi:hypothetical protein
VGIGIGILLTVLAVAVIAWPLLRRRPGSAEASAAGAILGEGKARTPEGLREARGEIYRLVRQLENDRAAGLVGEPEYAEQLDELRTEAARLLQEEAASEGAPLAKARGAAAPDPAAALEREIEEARATLSRTSKRPAQRGKR